MGAFIFRDHVNIGRCTHQICDCIAHGHSPDVCLNFIPKPNKEVSMPFDQAIKDRAYTIDPDCWKTYSANATRHKQRMDSRRTASLEQARKELEEEGVSGPAVIPTLLDKMIIAIDDGLGHFGYPTLDATVRGAIRRRIDHVLTEEKKPALQVALEEVMRTPSADEAAHDACAMGAAAPPADRYCVVGVDSYQRTYYSTVPAAEAAAAKMVRDNVRRQAHTSGVTPKKLLVVKAITIVEEGAPIPPEITVRAPVDADYKRLDPDPRPAWKRRSFEA